MERDALAFALRARAAQLLTYFFGPERQVQVQGPPMIQSDRVTYDGSLRGLDDPDSRARALQVPALAEPARPPADVLAAFRGTTGAPGPVAPAVLAPGALESAPAVLGALAARVTLLQHTVAAQGHALQQGHGRGY
jgi:hypothetical protein